MVMEDVDTEPVGTARLSATADATPSGLAIAVMMSKRGEVTTVRMSTLMSKEVSSELTIATDGTPCKTASSTV